jgi:uracil-DNA glycosylase
MASDREDRLRSARQMLESIRSAGIEWLPRASATAEPEPTEEPHHLSLFDDAASGPAMTIRQRKIELSTLAEQVAGCTRCKELAATRTQTVFGVGPFDPEICFIGEAPGADEDKQGEPFVGAAGKLLTRIIEACGLKREEVYIANALKCRPPGNRTPKPDEVENCREYLDKQLALIRPKYIVALGATAAQRMLKTTAPMGKLRGKFHEVDGIPMMVTYHPAYLLPHRAPEKKADVWEDMKMLLRKLGRPIPKGKNPQ